MTAHCSTLGMPIELHNDVLCNWVYFECANCLHVYNKTVYEPSISVSTFTLHPAATVLYYRTKL